MVLLNLDDNSVGGPIAWIGTVLPAPTAVRIGMEGLHLTNQGCI